MAFEEVFAPNEALARHLDVYGRPVEHPRHTQRTVEWGNWGITFMDPQPDRTKNFGVIIGRVHFAIGARGPIDAGPVRATYLAMCKAWVERGERPAGFLEG